MGEITEQQILELYDVRVWIKARVDEYQETPRAGVPRGEKLAPPRHKYHAALLMLLYGSPSFKDLTQIAREARIEYSLLGKWRTEKNFLDVAVLSAHKFLGPWIDFFVDTANELRRSQNEKEKDRCQ